MNGQMSMFDYMGKSKNEVFTKKLEVVRVSYQDTIHVDWKDLFQGFDELYAITFSSGIHFVNQVLDQFRYAEIIFGTERVMSAEIAAVISMQISCIQRFVKSKGAKAMAERLEAGTLSLLVSRDTRSHEKIFILKAKDGRRRVITGSANMSASAFCGLQRENITCFDDEEAYVYFKDLFDSFKEQCADQVSYQTLFRTMEDPDYLQDNIEEIPIAKTIQDKKMVILEESGEDKTDDLMEEIEIIADIKELEKELKPMIPRQKKTGGKIVISGETLKTFKRKYTEQRETQKIKKKQLPKLHINYETGVLDFNGKEMNMKPSHESVARDVKCLTDYLDSLNCFYGNVGQSQKDYFKFMNWYFASPFMPYLRYVASKNSYDVTPFPVVGIIYGDSNGGKSTFIRLLTKLMTGHRVPMNSSQDFTFTRIESLKRGCEGFPINVDDLAKAQFTSHSEKVIKDDDWGIQEGLLNYPSIAITTNKLASLPQDITKRTVTCHIDARIDKDAGAKNSRRINESMKLAGTDLYCAYVGKMLKAIEIMEEKMKNAETDYFPDIFQVSSEILRDIIVKHFGRAPVYVEKISYTDYFGDKAVGRNAMEKIMTAWKNEPKQFKVDKKNNKLIYSYPEQGRFYELVYIQQELPPVLNARLTAKSIVMDLEQAREIFEIPFRKSIFAR